MEQRSPAISRTPSWAVSPQRKRDLERGFIGLLAIIITALFAWMIAPYLATLFLAAVLALLLQGPHDRLMARLGGRPRLSACLVVGGSVLALIIPAALLLSVIVEQTAKLADLITPWIRDQVVKIQENGLESVDWLPLSVRKEILEYQATIAAQLSDLAGKITPIVVKSLRMSTGSVGTLLAITLNFLFLIYALLIFLLTGRETMRYAISLVPMPAQHRQMLVERALSTIRATVKGSMLIALVQGSLTGIGLIVTGVPLAVFWGAVAALFSIIPLIGPPLIWVPAALWLYVTDSFVACVGLMAWGGLVSTSDNILRPILVGKDAKMGDLMVLVSTLGGLTLFGAVGLIIGPVIGALLSSVWYIYGEAFDEFLDEGAPGLAEYAALVDVDEPNGNANGDGEAGPGLLRV